MYSVSHNWHYTKCHDEEQMKMYGDKLYYFEPGCEYGYKEADGYVWYRICTSYWFGDWVETQNHKWWRIHGGRHRAIYIVREDLLTYIRLKWL